MADAISWSQEPDDASPNYKLEPTASTHLDLVPDISDYTTNVLHVEGLDSYPSLHGYNYSNAPTSQPFSPTTSADPMARFIQSDGAWNAQLAQAAVMPANMSQLHANDTTRFTSMRMPVASDTASFEPGQLGQDFDYQTGRRTYSVGSGEPCMANLDSPGTVNSLNRLRPFASSQPASIPDTPPASVHADDQNGSSRPRHDYQCPYCDHGSRLNSEMKKHILKHERPFVCSFAGCPKSQKGQGFTTPNDLDRHKRTKHHVFPEKAKVYVCASADCAEGARRWLRQDNFKQHLARMHKNEDMEQLIIRSERIIDSTIPNLATGSDVMSDVLSEAKAPTATSNRQVAASGSFSQTNIDGREYAPFNSFSASSSFATHTEPLVEGCMFPSQEISNAGLALQRQALPHLFHQEYRPSCASQYTSNPMNFVSTSGHYPEATVLTSPQSCPSPQNRHWGLALSSHSSQQNPPSIIVHQPQDSRQQREQDLAYLYPEAASPSLLNNRNRGEIGVAQRSIIDEMCLTNPQAQAQVEAANARGRAHSTTSSITMRRRRRRPNIRHEAAAASLPNVNFNSVDSSRIQQSSIAPGVRCRICQKVLPRSCDMKKHERRHTRPFGCTYDMCHKQFGSKNDWKRHETSQHSQEDLWRCDLYCEQPAGARRSSLKKMPCNGTYFSKATLAAHLQRKHKVNNKDVDVVCETKRIGRRHQDTFWCGFCRRICPLEQENKKAWDERFDHIGDHFIQEDKRITEWLPPHGHDNVGKIQAARRVAQQPGDRIEPDSSGEDGNMILQRPPSPDAETEAQHVVHKSPSSSADQHFLLATQSRSKRLTGTNQQARAYRNKRHCTADVVHCPSCGDGPHHAYLKNAQCSCGALYQ